MAAQVLYVTQYSRKFKLYIPDGWNPTGGTEYRLMICLGGDGQDGSDLSALDNDNVRTPVNVLEDAIAAGDSYDYPTYPIMYPLDTFATWAANDIISVIDFIDNTLIGTEGWNINPQFVITGLSGGADGNYVLATRNVAGDDAYIQRFDYMILLSGRGTGTAAEKHYSLSRKIWHMVGDSDALTIPGTQTTYATGNDQYFNNYKSLSGFTETTNSTTFGTYASNTRILTDGSGNEWVRYDKLVGMTHTSGGGTWGQFYPQKGGDGLYLWDAKTREVFASVGETVAVTDVTLTPESFSVAEGDTQQLSVDVSPANATNKSVTYSSSNTGVATVNASGLVTAIAEGAATITATTVDGGFTDTASATITAASNIALNSIFVNPQSWSFSPGQTKQIVVSYNPSDATNKNVTYTSSDESVVTVNSSGLVTGIGGGIATITVTAEDGGHTDTAEFTVQVAVQSVDVSPASFTIVEGNIQQLVVSFSPADSTDQTGAWSSSNESVATVNSSGLVTALSPGSVTIAFTSTDGGFTDSSVGTIEAAAISVTGVTVAPNSFSIPEGQTQQLTATIAPNDATDQTGVWSSSNQAVATVDSNGLVTGVSDGNSVITFTTTDGSFSDTSAATITQSIVSVTGVTLDPVKAIIDVGDTQQFLPTVSPTNATNKNVSYSSSDESRLIVDSNGLATSIQAGNVKVTVTTQDGSFSDVSEVVIRQIKPQGRKRARRMILR